MVLGTMYGYGCTMYIYSEQYSTVTYIIKYNTIQHVIPYKDVVHVSTVQLSTEQRSIVKYSTVQYSKVQYSKTIVNYYKITVKHSIDTKAESSTV